MPALAGLVLLVAVAVPFALGPTVRAIVLREAAARGVPLALESASVTPWGQVVLRRACLRSSDAADAADWICAGESRLAVSWLSLLTGHPRLRSVSVSDVSVDASSRRGPLSEQREVLERLARGPGRAKADESAPREPRAVRQLPRVDVRGVVIDLTGQGLASERVEVSRATASGTSEAFSAMAVLTPHLDLAKLGPLPADVELPASWTVRVSRSKEEPGPRVVVTGERPVAVTSSRMPGYRGEVTGFGLVWPSTLLVESARLLQQGREQPVAGFDSAVVELRELTTKPEDIYLGSLRLDGLTVEVSRDAAGIQPLAGLRAALEQSQADAPDAGRKRGGTSRKKGGLWAGRAWYEKLPQKISLPGLRVTYRDSTSATPGPAVGIEFDELTYSLRALESQLDLSLRADLSADGRDAGEVTATAVWNYSRSNLKLDLGVSNVSVGPIVESFRGAGGSGAKGRVDLTVKVDEAERGPGLEFSGNVEVSDLELALGGLKAPLTLDHASYAWKAVRGEQPERNALVWKEGRGDLNGMAFTLTPTLGAFDYTKPLPFDRAELRFSVPAIDAMKAFRAIPPSLRQNLEGTRMGGEWGVDFAMTARVAERQGRIRVSLGEPEVFEVHDETLSLLALPEAVDVRRLNGPLEFAFTGSEGSVQRTLSIEPPSAWMYGDEAAEADLPPSRIIELGEGEAAAHRWTPLENMPFWLVATQLYREDNRFFRNDGINWMQLRLVVEEAINERKLGRGASTISMQLVKNVFLSHERAIERKFQELFLTYWMNRVVPKPRILEIYLNMIEWGPGVNGIAEAADYYFGKEPHLLTLPECVWISAISPAPLRRARQRETGVPPWMVEQVNSLMSGMVGRGYLRPDEVARARAQRIRFAREVAGAGGDEAVEGSGGLVPSEAAPEFGEGEGAGLDPAAAPEEAAAALQDARQAAFLALPVPERLRSWAMGARKPRGPGPTQPE